MREQHHTTYERATPFDTRRATPFDTRRATPFDMREQSHITECAAHATRHRGHRTRCHSHSTLTRDTHTTLPTHSPHATRQVRSRRQRGTVRLLDTDTDTLGRTHTRDTEAHRQETGTHGQATSTHGQAGDRRHCRHRDKRAGKDVQRSAGGIRTRSLAALLPTVACSWQVGCTDAANECVCV